MTVKRIRLATLATLSTLSINSAFALPIDWTGVFGTDTHLLNNVCRTSDTVTGKFDGAGVPQNTGTQGISGDCGASFQTYLFKLNPTIIVNDGVTLKGEFSSGYIRGGFAGDDATGTQNGTRNNSYFFTTPAQRSGLNVNQMYMELYADTALIKIGRMSKHYGLGTIWNAGNNPWDRFLTIYDGIEAEMKIGNFSLIPSYAKISSFNTNAQRAQPNGTADVRETSVIAKYDNKNRDLVVSLMYAKRFSEKRNSLYQSTQTTAGDQQTGKTDVTLINPYVSKKWNKFTIAAEAPMMTGTYGNVYSATESSKVTSTAYIIDAKYDLNPKWLLGFNGGQVSGDDGQTSKFEGMYLHPNFQVADLMFRYNYAGFSEGGRSIFDASINNARYYKVYGNYRTDKWTWKGALIMASAQQTAQAGKKFYHHEENYRPNSTAAKNQSSNLGWEVDFGFDYRWNPNVTISGYYAYWKLGDYFAFSNTAKDLALANVHGGGLRATLEF